MATTFEERLKQLRKTKKPTTASFEERLRIIRQKTEKPITRKAPEPTFLKKAGRFGKELVRAVTVPVVKSILAPISLGKFAITGQPIVDLHLPFLGDVTPAKTIREAFGVGLQTAFLGLGGGALTGVTRAGGRQLLKMVGKEAIIGGGFGLGVGLEEELRGKELALPTAIGAGLGVVMPPTIRASAGAIRRGLIVPGRKLKEPIFNTFTKLADSAPIKFISGVRARLKRFGEPGEKILQGFEDIDKEKLLRAGAAIDNLDEVGFTKLNNNESRGLLDALEGRLSREKLPINVAKTFDVIDGLRQEIGTEASKMGLQVRISKGKTRPFFPRKDFFPHFVPRAKDLKKGALRIEVIDNSVRIGKFKDHSTATKVLDSYIDFVEREGRGGKFWLEHLVNTGQAPNLTEARGLALRVFKIARLKKFGQLEQARILDFPFYDPDPRRVIPKYLLGSFERLETVKTFGQKAERLNGLLGRIHRLKGVEEGKEASLLMKQITGAIDRSPKTEQLALGLRTLQIPKLAFAQIINIGQPVVNGILKADIPAVAFGLSKAFTQIGRRRALRAGATLDTTIREVLAKAGGESKFASKFLKLTGFTASEKFNRIVSANTGMRYLERTFNKLKKNPQSRILRARIEELGVNPDDILQRGVIEKDLLTAGQKFTNITQFRGRAIDLPAFVNSPEGKVVFQFKTFAFSQARLLKDTIKLDIQNGNWTGVVKTLVILGTVFPATGEVLQDIRGLVTRKPRPTNALDRYIDDIISAGGLGIASDLWQAAEWESLAESILGPTVGTFTGGAENAVKSIKQGKVTNSSIKFILNQFGVLRPLKNIIFPPKPR